MSTVSSESPKVQYSVQRELSDGSLNRISVRVPYFSKDDIHVYVSDVEIKDTTVEGSKYTWRWDGDYIAITPNVDQGIEVVVRRITPIDEAIHIFDGRSEFDDQSMDENFQQLIYIAQEYSEGYGIKDAFSDISMHGYKIKNVGWATDDDDVVTYGQYKKDAEGAHQAKEEAKQWANKTDGSVDGKEYSAKYYALKSREEVRDEIDIQSVNIRNKADYEIQRVEDMADLVWVSKGVACAEQVWVFNQDVAKGTVISLPEPMYYIVGKNHIRLSYDGVILSRTWFNEVGTVDSTSNLIELLVDVKAGQEMSAWISPLGLADMTNLVQRIEALENAFADLSTQMVRAETTN